MKKSLIFVLFLSFLSYSQDGITDYLLVEKDSASFYTFTKKGMYLSSFDINNEINYTYAPYSSPPPKSFTDIPTNTLSAVNSNGIIYLLYPGGGILYRYSQNAIERIDESFPHRNQFSGFFFDYKNELYLLGGYGYWAAKNYLTKFSFESKSWDIVPFSGDSPKDGINQGCFVKTGSSVFVFDFFSKKPETLIEEKNDFLYELNLSNSLWTKKGRLNSPSPASSIEEAIPAIRAKYNHSLFEKVRLGSPFRIVDPVNNIVRLYLADNDLSKLSKNSIFVGSRIVYASRSADNMTHKIAFANVEKYLPILEEKHIIDDEEIFQKYLLFSTIFLTALIMLLFVFFKSRGTLYTLSGLSLFNDKGLILLSKEEVKILFLFVDSIRVENNVLLELFSDESKSFDAIIKRKNKAIKDLNKRFNDVFSQDLIFKTTDTADSRQVVYSLASKTRILAEEPLSLP